MRIAVTSDEFELELSFCGAMSDKAFAKVIPQLEFTCSAIERSLISADCMRSIEDAPDNDWLKVYTKRLIILTTMADSIRSRDLILTDTGFGVVSNTNIAPASTARVDNLVKEIKWKRDMVRETLIDFLRAKSGWGLTHQAKANIRTLLYTPKQLEVYTGMHEYRDSSTSTSQYFGDGATPNETGYHKPTFEDLTSHNREIYAADAMLRRHISDALMEELLIVERTASYDDAGKQQRAIAMARNYIGSIIGGSNNADSKNIFYANLINFIESDKSVFATYFASNAYKLNHYESYKNKQEDSGYFFG